MNNAKPVHEIRLRHVKAAIWRNESETGAFYSASFERVYRDGDQWKHAASFNRDDLLVLGKVADQAHTWICTQPYEQASQSKATPPETKKFR